MKTISKTRSVSIHRTVVLLTVSMVFTPGCSTLSSGLFSSPRAGKKHGVETVQTELPSKDRAQVCLRAGINFAAHEKDELAIVQFQKARRFDPQLRGVAHPLAVLYDRQGRFSLAEREYKTALAEMGPDADLLNDFGYFRYSQGNLEEASRLLSHARQQDPNHMQAKVNMAMVSAAQGHYETAFALFAETVGTAAAHQNMGILMLRAGQDAEAVAHFEAATKLDPSLTTSSTVLARYVPAQPSPRGDIGAIAHNAQTGSVQQASWQVIDRQSR